MPTAVECRWFRACLCLAVACGLALFVYAGILDRRASVIEARQAAVREKYANIRTQMYASWRDGAKREPSERAGFEWVKNPEDGLWYELHVRQPSYLDEPVQNAAGAQPNRATAVRHRSSVFAWAAGLFPLAVLVSFYAVRWIACGRWVPLWPLRSQLTIEARLESTEAVRTRSASSPLKVRGKGFARMATAIQVLGRSVLTVLRWLLLAIAMWQIIAFIPMSSWLTNLDQVTLNMWAIAVVKAIVGLTCWGLAEVAKWLRNKIPGGSPTTGEPTTPNESAVRQ